MGPIVVDGLTSPADDLSSSPEGPQRPRRHRTRFVVIALCLLVLLWVASAGRLLVATDEPVRSDAVVVLSGDSLGNRLRKGVEVFRRTRSSRLVVFVEDRGVYGTREAAARFLAGEDVDADVVRMLPPGASTAEEAGVIAAMAYRCGWRTITVVTSPFHTRRAGWLVRRAVGLPVEVAVVATDEPFNAATWWSDEANSEAVLLEWVKGLSSLRYLILTPQGADPGAPC